MEINYEARPMNDHPVRNGEVWRSPSHMLAIIQYLKDDQWMLLSTPSKAMHGGSCMMGHSEEDGTMFYTQDALHARLMRNGWVKTDLFAQCDGWPACRHDSDEISTVPSEEK